MVSQPWDTHCCVPSLPSLEHRAARTVLARPWSRLLHKGKCSAERLPSSDATPCPRCLGVFQSFLLLPYCPMLTRAGTGGSHPPLLPSVGFAVPPGSSMERHIPQHTSLEQDAGRATAVTAVVYPTQRLLCPFPNARRSPGTLAQVPACHLHLTLCSPLSHGQGTPPARPCPRRAVCAQTPTLAPARLSLLRPLPATPSKEPAGTKSFPHPPFHQEPGADLLSVKPWKAERADESTSSAPKQAPVNAG